jgi:hypothetical protein
MAENPAQHPDDNTDAIAAEHAVDDDLPLVLRSRWMWLRLIPLLLLLAVLAFLTAYLLLPAIVNLLNPPPPLPAPPSVMI